MNISSFSESRAAAVCRALLHVCSWIVPATRRAEWRAEWNAELWELCHRAERVPTRYPHPLLHLLAFTAGSLPHAIAEFRQEWRAELLWYDVRQALRFLRRNRGFSITSVLLIALGVGANTTVFTLVNAVLLRAPKGIEAPEEIVQIGRGSSDPRNFNSWSYPLFVDLRNRSTSFAEMAAYAAVDITIGHDEDVVAANAQLVTPNYFRLLGAPVTRGRAFLDDESKVGGALVAVISDQMWRRRFALDPEVVGRTLTVRGQPFRIIGVARPEFTGADMGAVAPDVWLPIATYPLIASGHDDRLNSRFMSWVWIIGRLKPGIGPQAAQQQLSNIFRGLQQTFSGARRDEVHLVRGLGLRPEERAQAGVVSGTLLAIVAAVLLIACANLAALLLARGAARKTELGIRLAVGASRNRVVRQLARETLIVAVVGSGTAFLLTRWTAQLVEAIMPYPLSVSFEPDLRVLAFALAVGVLTSAVFGALPSWRSANIDLNSLLRGGTPGISNRSARLRVTMLAGQIALSFTLLASTALLLRTVLRANTLDPGFRTDGVLVGAIDVSNGSVGTTVQTNRLEAIIARVRAEPGVLGAALASAVPAAGIMPTRTMWSGGGDADASQMISVSTLAIDTGYFHVMDVPILSGRQFDATRDRSGSTGAVVINEALAKLMWPAQNATGKVIAFGMLTGEQQATVIGVARNTKNRSLRADPAPQAYLLLSQQPTQKVLMHVRVAPTHPRIGTRLTQSIREVAPGTPPVQFETMRTRLARGFAEVRLVGILGTVFGLLALALATVGVYGVVSYDTSRRTREYGLRLALGAGSGAILSSVLLGAARICAAGIVLGLLATVALEPLLRRWVFGIAKFDPTSLTVAALVLTTATGLAAFLPAARAARADPMSSLRSD